MLLSPKRLRTVRKSKKQSLRRKKGGKKRKGKSYRNKNTSNIQ